MQRAYVRTVQYRATRRSRGRIPQGTPGAFRPQRDAEWKVESTTEDTVSVPGLICIYYGYWITDHTVCCVKQSLDTLLEF